MIKGRAPPGQAARVLASLRAAAPVPMRISLSFAAQQGKDGDVPRTELAPPAITPADLEDLRARLHGYREVVLPPGFGWERGTDGAYLHQLLRYWADSYEWREHEERIRAWPWALSQQTPTPVRAIHQRASNPAAMPVLLLHGWPDSVLRLERVLPMLTDLHVVVPCLPGFPFAAPIPEGGLSSAGLAEAVADAMAEFGYGSYVVSAGDLGCDVAESLAARYPERVAALHLTDVSQLHFLIDLPDDLSDAERAYVERGRTWQHTEGAYMHEQSTKPHTLAVGLGDSPAGLAAWLLEKLRSWTDSGGNLESVFTRDELLTWITAYWVTGSIGTSFTPYIESANSFRSSGRVDVPTAFTVFPRDLVNAPREFAERFFNVRSWSDEPAGGHFAAWECPDAYAQGIRTAIALAAS